MVSLGFGQLIGRLIGRVGPGVLDRLGTRQDWLRSVRHLGRDVEDFIVGATASPRRSRRPPSATPAT